MSPLPEALVGYRFIFRDDVRFADLDALGHVNNAVYATYLESARIAYYQELTGQPLDQLDIILAELTISYKAPAFFGDRIAIGARITSFGTKSFVMEYAIVREGDGTLLASGRSVLVCFDYELGQSVPVPDEVRRRVAEHQGE